MIEIIPGAGLHDKKRVYRCNGVREYIVWRTIESQLGWFVLQNDDYVSLAPDEQGIVRSQVFPGLWLAVAALLVGEMTTVLSVLQSGLQSGEHQEFVQQLTDRRRL